MGRGYVSIGLAVRLLTCPEKNKSIVRIMRISRSSRGYKKHRQEGDANSTNNEKVRALAEEIIVATEYSLPLWNGVVTKAWCKMLDLGGVQPSKSRKLAVDIRQRLQENREYVWKTRTSIKYGEEEGPQGNSDERNSTHPYKNTFAPAKLPNRYDKVHTSISDYIRDYTPEWYAEVDRVATMVEERATSARKKRDQTESQNVHVSPQWQLTQ
jgi:hypothetical protein